MGRPTRPTANTAPSPPAATTLAPCEPTTPSHAGAGTGMGRPTRPTANTAPSPPAAGTLAPCEPTTPSHAGAGTAGGRPTRPTANTPPSPPAASTLAPCEPTTPSHAGRCCLMGSTGWPAAVRGSRCRRATVAGLTSSRRPWIDGFESHALEVLDIARGRGFTGPDNSSLTDQTRITREDASDALDDHPVDLGRLLEVLVEFGVLVVQRFPAPHLQRRAAVGA